ncbi:MAG TPA: integron integrase [Rariglobus sp.]|jgi:integron integrase|nr:integron integrase [Rariglobus sp.]
MQTKDEVLAVVSNKVRVRGFALRTEEAYRYWIGRYYDFVLCLPKALTSEQRAEAFITHLAVKEDVAASTQNQAFAALLFLYKDVKGQPLKEVNALRAKRPEYVREAPSRDEVKRLLGALVDTPLVPAGLLARLLYGCGLRVCEPLDLRIKDVKLADSLLHLRGAKGMKDRMVPIPCSLIEPLRKQIERARKVWEWDHDHLPVVGVSLPHQLAKKYPNAPYDWGWFWVFPSGNYCEHPRVPGLTVRWRLHEAALQRTVSDARRRAGIATRITPHVLRHGYATHSTEDPRTIQQVMGHAQLETTMGYIHRTVATARSPLETL